jgi:hypothetical protein
MAEKKSASPSNGIAENSLKSPSMNAEDGRGGTA